LVEYKQHEILEDVFRSYVAFLEESSNFIFPFQFSTEDPLLSYKVTHEDIGVDGDVESELHIKEPIYVYELSSDPKMRKNLFEFFDKESNIITFKREIVGEIIIQMTCRPEIHIQTDFDLVPISSYPSITLEIMNAVRSEWDGPGNYPCYEINYSKGIAKAREDLRKYKVAMRVRSYASKPQDSLMLTGGVRRLVEQKDRIRSIAYDEYMELLWGPQNESNWVTENLFAQQFSHILIWKDWAAQDKPKEVPLVVHEPSICDIELIRNC
jgi:hypothetical protein